MESLPLDSRWRGILQHTHGDGIHQPWMDHMRKDAIKLAIFTFEFAWTDGGRKLKDWTLVREQYFRDYDKSQPVSEQRQLDLIRSDGLQQELAAAALARAENANWVEYPSEDRGEGYRQVYLADNEWLPVDSFSFFGHYGPGTTPLMHAALLGRRRKNQEALGRGSRPLTPSASMA